MNRLKLPGIFRIHTAFALLALSAGLTGCPGDQAVQQQIEASNAKIAELTKQNQALDAQVKAMATEAAQVKQLITQVSQEVLAHKDQIDQLNGAVTQLKSTPAPKAAAPHAGKKKK